MTIAGGVVLGSGVIMMVVGITGMRNNPANYFDDDEKHQKYSAVTAASTILTVAGSVFTIIGWANVTVAKKELKKFEVEVEPNPVISGVTVRLKF
jgi:hypothetical protein